MKPSHILCLVFSVSAFTAASAAEQTQAPAAAPAQAPAAAAAAQAPAAAPTQAPADAAGKADAGRQKSSMCVGCHNIPGYKTAFPSVYSVPKLDGQHAKYIVSALRAYKSGERRHPSMRAVAASLSDQDMADLAAFYASEPAKSASR
jgi:cytochrome c553